MPGPPTYVVDMHHSKRRRIRLCCLPSKRRRCSCVVWGWSLYNIVESESDPLTLTFSKKNPSRANGRSAYIHPPSLAKIRQRTSEEIGNTQTNKRGSNYSMMLIVTTYLLLQGTFIVLNHHLWIGSQRTEISSSLPNSARKNIWMCSSQMLLEWLRSNFCNFDALYKIISSIIMHKNFAIIHVKYN